MPPTAHPLIEALLRRASYGTRRINARGSAIGSALQPFAGRTRGYYSQLQGQESALGGSLNQSLAGQGQALGADIGTALKGIQAPAQAVSQYAGGTATTGAQSGAAVGALSSADLQRLQQQGSAEEIYAAALPRLAALAADQERRGFLEQMGEELTSKMAEIQAQDAASRLEEMRYQQERADDLRAERREIQRYQRDQRQKQRERRMEAAQARREAKRQAKLDALAQRAAAQEYGLDVANTLQDNATSAGNLTERQRHNRQLEAQARAREERQRKKDAAAGKTGGGDKTKYFDSVRDDAFRRAQSYGASYNPKAVLKKNQGVDRGTARARLWAEFGTLLSDRGFPRQTVKQMIERALDAAGY